MSRDFDPHVDYYEILQVHPRADIAVIRSAYRAIVRDLQAHPDLGGSHERAVLLNDAYRILSDEALRRAYDLARRDVQHDTPKAVPAAPADHHEVVCPTCGRRNYVPTHTDRSRAHCTSCDGPLFPEPFRVVVGPEQVTEENQLHLRDNLYADLKARGELELRLDAMPRGGKITCRRCRRVWTSQGHGPSPRTCPSCGAADWKAFRVFKCRYCGLEFTTPSLRRAPYLLFPACPGCDKPNWHVGLESGPISNLLRFLKS
jgi:DnaJ-class molecular chaperone